jgi:hypothetical protein
MVQHVVVVVNSVLPGPAGRSAADGLLWWLLRPPCGAKGMLVSSFNHASFDTERVIARQRDSHRRFLHVFRAKRERTEGGNQDGWIRKGK